MNATDLRIRVELTPDMVTWILTKRPSADLAVAIDTGMKDYNKRLETVTRHDDLTRQREADLDVLTMNDERIYGLGRCQAILRDGYGNARCHNEATWRRSLGKEALHDVLLCGIHRKKLDQRLVR